MVEILKTPFTNTKIHKQGIIVRTRAAHNREKGKQMCDFFLSIQ